MVLFSKMPRQKGSMKWEDSERIRINISFIKDEIDSKDLLDCMFTNDIFTQDDVEEVNGQRPVTRKNKNDAFIRILLKSGPEAYNVFIKALNDYPHVVQKLTETIVTSQPVIEAADQSYAWFSQIPEHVRTRLLNERELSRLSQVFGAGWEMVSIHLGFSKAEIDQVKLSSPISPTQQVFNIFQKWQKKAARTATLDAFIAACVDAGSSVTVDIEQMERIVKNMA